MHNSQSRWHSIQHALHGLKYMIQTQKNTWIYIPLTLIVILFGFLFKISAFEWIALVFCLGLVWSFECINTALESDVDLSTPEIHPLAKIAKDCAAAGVLITAITAGIVGLIIFLPRIIQFLQGG